MGLKLMAAGALVETHDVTDCEGLAAAAWIEAIDLLETAGTPLVLIAPANGRDCDLIPALAKLPTFDEVMKCLKTNG